VGAPSRTRPPPRECCAGLIVARLGHEARRRSPRRNPTSHAARRERRALRPDRRRRRPQGARARRTTRGAADAARRARGDRPASEAERGVACTSPRAARRHHAAASPVASRPPASLRVPTDAAQAPGAPGARHDAQPRAVEAAARAPGGLIPTASAASVAGAAVAFTFDTEIDCRLLGAEPLSIGLFVRPNLAVDDRGGRPSRSSSVSMPRRRQPPAQPPDRAPHARRAAMMRTSIAVVAAPIEVTGAGGAPAGRAASQTTPERVVPAKDAVLAGGAVRGGRTRPIARARGERPRAAPGELARLAASAGSHRVTLGRGARSTDEGAQALVERAGRARAAGRGVARRVHGARLGARARAPSVACREASRARGALAVLVARGAVGQGAARGADVGRVLGDLEDEPAVAHAELLGACVEPYGHVHLVAVAHGLARDRAVLAPDEGLDVPAPGREPARPDRPRRLARAREEHARAASTQPIHASGCTLGPTGDRSR
jgi:hypothetical protein